MRQGRAHSIPLAEEGAGRPHFAMAQGQEDPYNSGVRPGVILSYG